MKKLFVVILFSILIISGFSQNTNIEIGLKSGFNRVGFFNNLNLVGGLKNHRLLLGARHYTLDNFFEKNTIGFDLGYQYLIESKNEKFYFYPGVSASFFKENKTQAVVNLSDFKLINGLGINLNEKWSLNYQLGIGVLFYKSNLVALNEVTKVEYYNYEMSFGINYRFRAASKLQ